MKKALSFLLILCLAAGLSACAEAPAEAQPEGLSIVTTLFPAYDFARVIAGDRAEVTLLVPPGAEAHSFEPTARDILRI